MKPDTLRERYGVRPPTALDPRRTALVLVDFQDEYVHGGLPLPCGAAAIDAARSLVGWARAAGVLVVHVQHVRPAGGPLFAEASPGVQLIAGLAPRPEDLVVKKSIAGAFSRTDLDARLRAVGVDTLIVGGLMSHLAVYVTASDAAVLGYDVIVAGDATATRDLHDPLGGAVLPARVVKQAALAAIADRAAAVLSTPAILALPWDRESIGSSYLSPPPAIRVDP